jgi:hypothetical protein
VGPSCQRKERKEKEEGGGMGWRGVWLMGHWARKGGKLFSFFYLFFQTLLKHPFKFKFKPNFF